MIVEMHIAFGNYFPVIDEMLEKYMAFKTISRVIPICDEIVTWYLPVFPISIIYIISPKPQKHLV